MIIEKNKDVSVEFNDEEYELYDLKGDFYYLPQTSNIIEYSNFENGKRTIKYKMVKTFTHPIYFNSYRVTIWEGDFPRIEIEAI